MKKQIDEMKAPWFQPENMIGHRVDDMHQRPIVIGDSSSFETRYVRDEHLGDVPEISNPTVGYDLRFIVIDESVEKGIPVDCHAHEENGGDLQTDRPSLNGFSGGGADPLKETHLRASLGSCRLSTNARGLTTGLTQFRKISPRASLRRSFDATD